MVVMTTVGYGNQSPVTMQGRALVVFMGWICIICWLVILYVAGKVVGIILDDIFRKCHLRFLTGQYVEVLFFGLLGVLWLFVTALTAQWWWNERVDFDDKSFHEALWFSYVSLMTIGLGDYFLEPELLFYADVALWSFMFLTGFTFLCTFVDKIALLCEAYFPDSGEAMKERIRNTNLVGMKTIEYKQKNEAALENIGRLVKKMDDDDMLHIDQRVTRIRQKKELLIHLLYQTEEELAHFTQRGEQYESPGIARVSQEENMLEEILQRTSREREKLSRYRDGVPRDAPDPLNVSLHGHSSHGGERKRNQ
jgi:Ion channel